MTPQNMLDDARRQKLRELLAASIEKPAQTDTPVPNNQPTVRPITIPPNSPASALPTSGDIGPISTPAVGKVRLGTSTSGMSPAERQGVILNEMRNNPRANVDTSDPNWVEPKPPKLHHGLKDALKSFGRTAVLEMGEYARTHPDASGVELATAGATGGGIGAASPNTGDEMLQSLRIKDQEVKAQRALEVERQQADLNNAQMRPQIEAERIRAENQRTQEATAREDARVAETARHNRVTESRTPTERVPLLRTRKKADGSEETLKSTDNGATWIKIGDLGSEAPQPKPDKPEPDSGQLASWYEKKESEKRQLAQSLTAQADALKDKVNTDYSAGQERERLLKDAAAANKDADEYRDKRDIEAVKPKPRSAAPTPKGGKLDPAIAIQRAGAHKGSALTPDEEAKVRAEVDRRNRGRQ